MYSPKIDEDLITKLWHLKTRLKGQGIRKPMTTMTNEAVAQYLNSFTTLPLEPSVHEDISPEIKNRQS